jgi:class 3 adenylate cyclase
MILAVGLALIVYDRKSASTRALAASFALWGSEELPRLWLRVLGLWPPSDHLVLLGWLGGYLSPVLVAEYLILVLRTAGSADRVIRIGHGLLRLNQFLTVFYIALQVIAPDLYHQYERSESFGLWTFKSVELLANVCLVASVVILIRWGVDIQERFRVLSLVVATPFFLTSGVLPSGIIQVLSSYLGVLIILVGCTGYLVMQGRRGEFMSRFLSPQIRDRVRDRGLQQALEQKQDEITIVCCDLRGFTGFAQAYDSNIVIGVLQQYYDAAGQAASRCGATIKDFAGDGVLFLIGAPEPRTDHAQAGLQLARELQINAAAVVRQCGSNDHPLGLGIGVASGRVTVGVIESQSRLEYAAVGSAVNLAARLCSIADDGEIRVAARTAELTQATGLRSLSPVALKGFGDAVEHYAW